jgi:restriction endonuclease S subunit
MIYKTYRIDNICSMVKGTYPTMNTESGGYPLVVTAEYRRSASTYQLEGPAVCVPLISSTGHGDAALHRVHYQEGKFALANLLVALIPYDLNLCDDKYLYHLLMAKKDEYFVPLMSGTANVSLKMQDIAGVKIPLPPIEEQRRIVARIEELAAKIEEARGLRHRSVEEVGSLEVSAAREVFTSLNGVNVLPLRELVTMYGGGTPSKLNPTFWLGTIPWISPKDMKVREISNAIDHISEEAIESSPTRLIDPGTVLIVTRGMILAHTVPSAILRVQATINQDMKALVPSELLLPEYLCNTLWALNEELLKLVEKSTHDTRKLETPKLLEFKIPVPSLSEQQRIIAYLDNLQYKVNCLKQLQAETSAELDALLPSILDKAFKGEL